LLLDTAFECYRRKNSTEDVFVFAFSGQGFWDNILALSLLIVRASRSEASSLPTWRNSGLGGRISEPEFKARFKERSFATKRSDGLYFRMVAEGSANRGDEIDGITGATGTSSAVEKIVKGRWPTLPVSIREGQQLNNGPVRGFAALKECCGKKTRLSGRFWASAHSRRYHLVKKYTGNVSGLIFTLAMSCFTVSLMRNVIPRRVRMIIQVLIIAAYVIFIKIVLDAFCLNQQRTWSLVGLIITNCIVMGRPKATPWPTSPSIQFSMALAPASVILWCCCRRDDS
jgi:hypothetical protein